jgi:hypothetical protein
MKIGRWDVKPLVFFSRCYHIICLEDPRKPTTDKASDARYEVLTAVKIHIEDFWVVTACNGVVGYQRFRGTCCLHLQGEVNMG